MSNLSYELSKENPFQGTIEYKSMPYKVKTKLLRTINLLQINMDDKSPESTNRAIELSEVLYDICRENIVSMNITKGENKVTDLDELESDKDAANFFNEVGSEIAKGNDLGKKRPSA